MSQEKGTASPRLCDMKDHGTERKTEMWQVT